MSRQIVVHVFGDLMMPLARCVQRIDMNCGVGQIPQMMQKLVSNLRGNLVPLANREPWVNGDVHLRMKSVAQPSHAHFGDIPHVSRMIHCMSNLIEDLRVYAVEQTGKDPPAGFPYDVEDGNCNEKTNDGVRQRHAQPDSDGPEKNGQTGQPIDAGVIAVGNDAALPISRPTRRRNCATTSLPRKPIIDATHTAHKCITIRG